MYALTNVVERMSFFLINYSKQCDCSLQDTADILGGDLFQNYIEPHLASCKCLWEMMKAPELSDIWRIVMTKRGSTYGLAP